MKTELHEDMRAEDGRSHGHAEGSPAAIHTAPGSQALGVWEVVPALVAGLGVTALAGLGLLRLTDVGGMVATLWRPLLTILAIMVIAAAAQRVGLLSQLAASVLPLARGSTTRLFLLVFVLAAATSATLNNDASVLLLTPLVILLVRRSYPDRPDLLVPFAFAVFMAAGVAPLPVSNPINLIVADYAGIPFNQYAVTMVPISLAGWGVTFFVLRQLFLRRLTSGRPAPAEPGTGGLSRPQRAFLFLLIVILGAYPVVTALGGPVWLVASAGAFGGMGLAWRYAGAPPSQVLSRDVSWGTLAFLAGVLLVAVGLRNAGVVELLAGLYERASIFGIGGLAAVLSALFNNHPTAFVNMLAIESATGTGEAHYLAVLIGGDLGPRLLPTGSLAGLLWLASLRRMDVRVPLRQFIVVGAAVTIPALLVSLLLLALQ